MTHPLNQMIIKITFRVAQTRKKHARTNSMSKKILARIILQGYHDSNYNLNRSRAFTDARAQEQLSNLINSCGNLPDETELITNWGLVPYRNYIYMKNKNEYGV